MERLTKSNITGDFKYIEIVPKKTKGISPESISIPIFDQVLDIFQKYLKQGEKILPPILSNQMMNDYIKDVGEERKTTYPHRYEQRVGNQTVVVETAEYKLITTPTTRRSFATNAYLRPDVKPIDIMAITGHRTEAAIMRYIKMSNKDAAWKNRSN